VQQGCNVTRRECADRSLVEITGERRDCHLRADCCSRAEQVVEIAQAGLDDLTRPVVDEQLAEALGNLDGTATAAGRSS
jgi:hypothetical protein